ncbi:hypothetical protein PIROE2DRAFT_61198 [Piromyces sp. E2]|nr:hypothetical protein PIROE2DRAFT_61198 [Piromyces sp. E2]|eukprot:OUM63569.1 hypothetical protein PIROE2DRAFT_61198 [Piromyces sp. E2]
MAPQEYPLFKAEVDVDAFPVTYNYMVKFDESKTETEQFQRQREKGAESLNEFFNRSITVKKHPELPRAYEAFQYFEPSKLYDDSFVATIVVKCDENQLNSLYQDTDSVEKIAAEVIYASPYTVKTFKEAKFGLSGESTREVPKLSYRIKNLKNAGKELYNRTSLKLRAEHMDVSYLRDKIYADQENPIYKASCDENDGVYGDLGYYGDDVSNQMYDAYSYKGDDKTQNEEAHIAQDIIPLVKAIDDYKNGSSNNFPLDADTFLKSMALEFLAGAIDNYWNKPGNYFLYKDNSKNQWYFHDADFHYTFGINYREDVMLNTPLSEYPPADENIKKERPPLDALRSHPENETKFKGIIERLLKTSFNEKALFPRIDSMAELIREDAQWDISITPKENPNPTSGRNMAENIETFDKEAKSEEESGFNGGFTFKYFIKTRISLVASELNIEVPADYEKNLGTVTTPYANVKSDKKDGKKGKDAKSASIKTMVWNKHCWTLAIAFIMAIFFY